MHYLVLAMVALLVGVAQPGLAQPKAKAKVGSSTCSLLIHVTGFRTDKGKAGAAVFNSPKGWPSHNRQAFTGAEIPITDKNALFKFAVPPGTYAIVVIDDVNENKKLDRDFWGIPSEGFGFANNPKVFLRAPSFKAASIQVHCPVTRTDVHLKYR